MAHDTDGESYMFPIDRVFYYAFSPADDLFPPIAITHEEMRQFQCTLLNKIRQHKDESPCYRYPHFYYENTRGPSYADLEDNPFCDIGDYFVCSEELPEDTAAKIEARYDNDPVVVEALRTARASIRQKRTRPKAALTDLSPKEQATATLEMVTICRDLLHDCEKNLQ